MKKVLCLLLSALLISGLFCACAPGEMPPESNDPIVSNTEVDKEKEPIEISFCHWRAEDKETYQKIIDDFREVAPHITITEEIIPSGDYMNVLQTRLSGGEAPDLFGINGIETWGPKFNEAGYLEPLNDVEAMKNIAPSFNEIATDDDGNQYAAIWNDLCFGIIYNSDLFEEAGVSPPKDWNDFLNVCKKLQDKGIAPMTAGLKDAHVNSWVAYMIMVNDCFAKDPDVYEKINRRELTFSEADAIRSSLDKFQQLVDNGILNMDHLGLAYGDAMTVFAQGKAAMVPDGSFAVPAIMAANPDIKLGSFSIPGDNGESTVWGSLGMTYSVNKNISDEKKAAAKEFLSFMLDKTVSKEFSEATALFTTLSDVELQYEDPVINDFAKMATGDMFIIPSLDSSVVDATWGNVFWDGLQGIVAGTETTQSILEDLDGKVIE